MTNKMNEAAPPPLPTPNAAPHVTLSRQLWSGFLTLSMCFGAIGGIGVLLLGDNLFKTGPDPAIHAPEIQSRLEKVEQAVAEKPDLQKIEQDLSAQSAQTASLQQKIEKIDQEKTQNSDGGTTTQVLLGLTQLKTAYENDLPFDTGLGTLRASVTQPQLKGALDKLTDLSAKGLPTKAALLQDVQSIAGQNKAPEAELMLPNQTLKERAITAVKNFVQVRPTAAITQEGTVANLGQAIQSDNMPLASNLVAQLPASAATQALAGKLALRAEAQKVVQQLVSQLPLSLHGAGSSTGAAEVSSVSQDTAEGSIY